MEATADSDYTPIDACRYSNEATKRALVRFNKEEAKLSDPENPLQPCAVRLQEYVICPYPCRFSPCTNQRKRLVPGELEVRETTGRGMGLFALRDFDANEQIIEYVGVYTLGSAYNGNSDISYVMEIYHGKSANPRKNKHICPGSIYIDSRVYGNIARFANHSCAGANGRIDALFDLTSQTRLMVICAGDLGIRSGEEITIQYCENGPGFPCSCGTCD